VATLSADSAAFMSWRVLLYCFNLLMANKWWWWWWWWWKLLFTCGDCDV